MAVVGVLFSLVITLAVAVVVASFVGTLLLGAVRGLSERQANRPVMRVFLLLVAVGLGVILVGMGNALVEMALLIGS